jgi:hypothetical protein
VQHGIVQRERVVQVSRRKAQLIAAAVTATALSLIALAPLTASAAGERSFEATAAADGVRSLTTSPGAPLTDEVADAGGPTAQARLSSIGTSTGFAAYPFPGSTVLGAPATAGTSQVSYPFAVSSSYPVNPTATSSQGPYSLAATSQEARSTASAGSGSNDPAGSAAAAVAARATVSLVGGTVTAQAESDDHSLGTGPLSLGRVHATALLTAPATGAPTRTWTFEAEGLSAGGMAFSVGPAGLTVAGTTTPLPDSSPVTSVLAGAGIKLTYIAAEMTPTSVTSAGLKVAVTSPGGQTTTYLLGRALARVTQAVDAGATTTSGFPPPPPPPTSGTPAGPAPLTPLAGAPAPDAGTAPVTPVVAASAAPAPIAPVAASITPAAAVVGWPRSYFLVLAGGGLLAVVGAVMISLLGVRYP